MLWRVWWAWLCLGLAPLWLGGQDDSKLALLIGNSSYSNGFRELPQAVVDVDALSKVLTIPRYGFRLYAGKVHTNLTGEQMRKLLTDFRKSAAVTKAKTLLIYYSGHGLQQGKEQYLLGIDVPAANTLKNKVGKRLNIGDKANDAWNRELHDYSLQVNSQLKEFCQGRADRLNIVILDACRCYVDAMKSMNERWDPLQAQGTYTLYATNDGRVAYDGVFARHFVALLKSKETPLNEWFPELKKRISAATSISTGGAQEIEELNSAGKVYLAYPPLQISWATERQRVCQGRVKMAVRVYPQPREVRFVWYDFYSGRQQQSKPADYQDKVWQCSWDAGDLPEGPIIIKVCAVRAADGKEYFAAERTVAIRHYPPLRLTWHQLPPAYRGEVELAVAVTPQAKRVEFLVNGVVLAAGHKQGKIWKCRWDTRAYPNGNYALTARAIREQDQREFTGPKQPATVANLEPLQVNLGEIAATISDTVKLTAQVGPSVPRRVEFIANGNKLGEGQRQGGEWVYRWDSATSPEAEYQIYARAERSDGQWYSSAKVKTTLQKVFEIEVEIAGKIVDWGWINSTDTSYNHREILKLTRPGQAKLSWQKKYNNIEFGFRDGLNVSLTDKDVVVLSGELYLQTGTISATKPLNRPILLEVSSKEWRVENSKGDNASMVITCRELSYGLPKKLWFNCRYQHAGRWLLDMTGDYWANLSVVGQQIYAAQYQRGYAASIGQPVEKTFTAGGTAMVMRLIPPGRYWMGSPDSEKDRYRDEQRHRVVISRGYWLGKYEVTQGPGLLAGQI